MNRLPLEYFAPKYAADPDPWGFASRWYEARKYALTVAALPRPRYARGFEPGCSIGVLTRQLAARCDALLACDLVPEVAARTGEQLRDLPHVAVHALAIPEQWPDGRFDLIVLSEVAYYLTEIGIAQLLARIDDCLEPGGHVVAVHWTGETDYPIRGDALHEQLDRHRGWQRLAYHRDTSFVLSVYQRSTA